MFLEKVEEEYIITQMGTSEGTQIKYKKDGYWYKKDNRGKEGLVEYLVSRLLTFSDMESGDYVLYEPGYINDIPGCRSKNFLQKGEELVTAYRQSECQLEFFNRRECKKGDSKTIFRLS